MTQSQLKVLRPVRTIVVDEPILKTSCKLGEGPLWDASTQTLHFIDIDLCRVFHYHPESGKLDMDQYEEPIGCLALRKGGDGLACAAKRGFALLEPTNPKNPGPKSSIKYLSQPLPSSYAHAARFNDGACDPRGRFWAGTLEFTHNGEHIPGQLWMFDPIKNESNLIDNRSITDSNGLGWSKDMSTLYFTNSTVNEIYAYDYDVESGQASNRRIFIDGNEMKLSENGYGAPDGFCIDREGYIWCARWKGSRIVRFTPDGKGIDLEVHIPKAYHVTACCFGGPNLDKLYITTAACHANNPTPSEEELLLQEKFPQSGDVFAVDFAQIRGSKEFADIGVGIGDVAWRWPFAI